MDILTDQAFFRSFHILFGIAWIGLLYYFNFVQGEYVKVADPDAKADVFKKLAPNALWWFRWAALFTFLTGVILLHQISVRIGTQIIFSSLNLLLASLDIARWPLCAGSNEPPKIPIFIFFIFNLSSYFSFTWNFIFVWN